MAGRVARTCSRCGARFEDSTLEFCRHDGTRLGPVGAPATGDRSTPRRDDRDPAPEEPTVDPLVGAVVAERFRVTELLGRGGMGAVYAADHLVMKRRVALKILRSELSGDATAVARFEREAHAASRIESPDVVRLFDFGRSDDGLLYIAMEHVDGESLATRLDREGALPPDEAVRIAIRIARALDAAHRAQVVHRDLKPDNVMLLGDGSVRVLDFGIARILEDDPGDGLAAKLTQAGAIIGTPMYMSPEAAGRTAVGPRADLYSLGVIVFEMLVGRPPFDDPQPVLLMGMHLRVPPELVREARPGITLPDELEALVDRLLAKDPEDRPRHAGEVVDALERLRAAGLSAESIGDGSALVAARAERSRTRHGTADSRHQTTRGVAAQPTASTGTTLGPVSSTDPTPPAVALPPPRARWPALTAATVAVVAIVAVVAWSRRPASEPTAGGHAAGERPQQAPDAGARATSLLRFSVEPPYAEVSFDGRVLPDREIALDPQVYRFVYAVVVRAPGYRTRTLRVRADVNQTIPVELERETPVAAAETVAPTPSTEAPDAGRRSVRARSPTAGREPGRAPAAAARSGGGSVDDMFRQTKIIRRTD